MGYYENTQDHERTPPKGLCKMCKFKYLEGTKGQQDFQIDLGRGMALS